jgi:hypothetical protein
MFECECRQNYLQLDINVIMWTFDGGICELVGIYILVGKKVKKKPLKSFNIPGIL